MTDKDEEVTLSPDFLQSKAQFDGARARYMQLAHGELDRLFGEKARRGDLRAQSDAIMVAAGQMDLAPTDLPSWLKKFWDELLPELAELEDKERERKEGSSETGDYCVDELNRDFRSRVEGRDGHAILDAISRAEMWGMDLPFWVLAPLAEAVDAHQKGHVRTLDEALGVKRPKGFHLGSTDIRTRVGVRLDCIALRNLGAAVDDRLFELVGARYGIGKTKAKDIYYRPHPTPTLAEHRKSPNFRQLTVESLKPELLEIFNQLRPDLATSAKIEK